LAAVIAMTRVVGAFHYGLLLFVLPMVGLHRSILLSFCESRIDLDLGTSLISATRLDGYMFRSDADGMGFHLSPHRSMHEERVCI
jgi:hypothetical protein